MALMRMVMNQMKIIRYSDDLVESTVDVTRIKEII